MNIPEEAIEKAARAIHGYPDAVWRNETTNSKNYYRAQARAALSAAAPHLTDAEELAWEPCGRGICAANEGHEGTCAEASGWDE